MGGFIHILLVIAIVVVLVRIITGKRPLSRQLRWGRNTYQCLSRSIME
jgi:hypothetical protein